jgi:hypothetical protein
MSYDKKNKSKMQMMNLIFGSKTYEFVPLVPQRLKQKLEGYATLQEKSKPSIIESSA